jgi:hypothetical protein
MIALTTDQIAKIAGDPQARVEVQWNQALGRWDVIPAGSHTIYFADPAKLPASDEAVPGVVDITWVSDLKRQRDAYLDRAVCAEQELKVVKRQQNELREAFQRFMRGVL